ncbi:MAG TPA: hypothetical protein VEZ70_10175 [Allosphingosinicella sp.]|nr:hypothetical protein [Allosphingosinicella sp.]
MDWHQLKQWLTMASGLDMDALHVHAGVVCQIVVALVLRLRLSSLWPWAAVAAVAFGNEVYDFTYEVWPTREEQFFESVKDVWNTLLVPTLLMLLVRWMPGLFVAPSAADPGEAGADPGEPRE